MSLQLGSAHQTWRPKIAENIPDASEPLLRWAAQLGLDAVALPGHVLDPDGLGYWTAEGCQSLVERVRSFGLEVGIVMLPNVTPRIILGQPGRDEDIARVSRSVEAAGAAGIPVCEYNFYNHRAVEGYGRRPGRGGCQYEDFDDSRLQTLPVLPKIGEPTAEETWQRLKYFLEAVCPVAERVGVRLALHPNNPPPPKSRGAAQVLTSFEGMKKLVELVPSVASGITFCQGSFSEWAGVDIVEAIHYFGSRDKIHHVHYRNPQGKYPRYVETWLDEGDTDMLRAMKAYRDVNYRFTLCSDHVPHMTIGEDPIKRPDGTAFGSVGRAFNHGFIRAMIQAVNHLA